MSVTELQDGAERKTASHATHHSTDDSKAVVSAGLVGEPCLRTLNSLLPILECFSGFLLDASSSTYYIEGHTTATDKERLYSLSRSVSELNLSETMIHAVSRNTFSPSIFVKLSLITGETGRLLPSLRRLSLDRASNFLDYFEILVNPLLSSVRLSDIPIQSERSLLFSLRILRDLVPGLEELSLSNFPILRPVVDCIAPLNGLKELELIDWSGSLTGDMLEILGSLMNLEKLTLRDSNGSRYMSRYEQVQKLQECRVLEDVAESGMNATEKEAQLMSFKFLCESTTGRLGGINYTFPSRHLWNPKDAERWIWKEAQTLRIDVNQLCLQLETRLQAREPGCIVDVLPSQIPLNEKLSDVSLCVDYAQCFQEMAKCQHFLYDHCELKDSCKKEHPVAHQSPLRPLFRRGGPWGESIVRYDADLLPMWLLSSCGPDKQPTQFNGLDESQDELRVKAVAAQRAGRMVEYMEYESTKIAAMKRLFQIRPTSPQEPPGKGEKSSRSKRKNSTESPLVPVPATRPFSTSSISTAAKTTATPAAATSTGPTTPALFHLDGSMAIALKYPANLFSRLNHLQLVGDASLICESINLVASTAIEHLTLTFVKSASNSDDSNLRVSSSITTLADKWSDRLTSLSVSGCRSLVKMPDDALSKLIASQSLKQLKLGPGVLIRSVNAAILEGQASAPKLEVLHLPVELDAAPLHLSTLETLAKRCPRLSTLRCHLDMSAVFPQSLPEPMSHCLKVLSIANISTALSSDVVRRTAHYLDILFPELQSVEECDCVPHPSDFWAEVRDQVLFAQASRAQERTRLRLVTA